MSPEAALQSSIFRAYLALVLFVLIGAGVVLLILQARFKVRVGTVWDTYRSWWIIAPLCALAVFAGHVPFILGATAVAIFAAREFARVARLDRAMEAMLLAGIAGVGWSALFGRGLALVIGLVVSAILLLPILRNRASGALRTMSLGLIGFLYLGWAFGQLGWLAGRANPYGYICFLLFATEVNDVAAFGFGKLFGRHPLRSAISPRKTCEGALGAVAVSLLLPWLLRFSFPFFGWWQLVLSGLIIGLGGTLGDLSISLLKRELGAKDMGSAIPGHGGVLDRIDSLIFTAPLFTQMVLYYYPSR
jgi:phosphatidate cytidylyltransferase